MRNRLDTGPWRILESIFEAARQLDAAERAAYLDKTCVNHPRMRREVEALLQASESTDPDPIRETIRRSARDITTP